MYTFCRNNQSLTLRNKALFFLELIESRRTFASVLQQIWNIYRMPDISSVSSISKAFANMLEDIQKYAKELLRNLPAKYSRNL